MMKKITCDECGIEFLLRSNDIYETYITIDGKDLFLTYFACPYCNTAYVIKIVEFEKYRELAEDFMTCVNRIKAQQGKRNPERLQNLIDMAEKKQERMKKYIEGMNDRYPGKFLKYRDNHGSINIKYLPRAKRG